jgi:hypothetical protein
MIDAFYRKRILQGQFDEVMDICEDIMSLGRRDGMSEHFLVMLRLLALADKRFGSDGRSRSAVEEMLLMRIHDYLAKHDYGVVDLADTKQENGVVVVDGIDPDAKTENNKRKSGEPEVELEPDSASSGSASAASSGSAAAASSPLTKRTKRQKPNSSH